MKLAKNKKILIVISLFLLFWQPTIFAQDGIYLTLAGGWADQVGLPAMHKLNATRIREDNFPAVRMGLGYIHDYSSHFGVGLEAAKGGYSNTFYYLPGDKIIKVYSETTEFMILLITYIKKIDLFVKVGGIRHTMDISRSDGHDSKTRIQPEIMTGIGYNFIPHFALTFSYFHSFGQSVHDLIHVHWKAPGLNAVLLGVRVQFF